MRKKLDDLKHEVKEEIVKILAEMYLLKNGCYPNWSEDEELVIYDTDFKNKILIDGHYEPTEYGYTMEQCIIEEFRVNCGGGLLFVYGDGMNERFWDETSVEELIGLYEYISKEENRK